MAIALGAYISDSAFYPADDSPPSGTTGLDTWRSTFGTPPSMLLTYTPWTIPSVAGTSQTDAGYAGHGFPQLDQRAFLVPRARGVPLFVKWEPHNASPPTTLAREGIPACPQAM